MNLHSEQISVQKETIFDILASSVVSVYSAEALHIIGTILHSLMT